MVDWPGIRGEVDAALGSVGQGGQPYIATLQKPSAPTGDPWSPTYPAAVNHSITVVQDFREMRDAAGTLIGQTLRRLYVSASGEAPEKNDRIAFGLPASVDASTVWYDIAAVRPLAPAGVAVMYEVDLVT